MAIQTGQPIGDLLACPPHMLRALRIVWNEHVSETNRRNNRSR